MNSRNYTTSEHVLEKLSRELESMPEDSARRYYFDFYQYKARIDSIQSGEDAWAVSLKKALHYPTDDHIRIRDIYGMLVSYHAGKDELRKALEMMDKMLRTMRMPELDARLKRSFYLYLDGKFESALQILKNIPDEEKDRYWKQLESFLVVYHNQLKPEDRFKLW